jgi:hypothetical protein
MVAGPFRERSDASNAKSLRPKNLVTLTNSLNWYSCMNREYYGCIGLEEFIVRALRKRDHDGDLSVLSIHLACLSDDIRFETIDARYL